MIASTALKLLRLKPEYFFLGHLVLFAELEVDVQIFRQRVNQHRFPMCLWALDKRTVPFSLTGKASVPLQTLHSNLYLDGSST